jgi:hypothetical protein
MESAFYCEEIHEVKHTSRVFASESITVSIESSVVGTESRVSNAFRLLECRSPLPFIFEVEYKMLGLHTLLLGTVIVVPIEQFKYYDIENGGNWMG